MVFGWLKSERWERRRKIRLDRKHLEARARRFLKIYLNADETRKPQFYRAVEEASKHCRPSGLGLPPPELEDAQIAEATSSAYHRAAGVYTLDKEMQELGTAAVHLLTMATSYMSAHDTEGAS
jgi:hypothetical protein